jgi:pimeloyl-ACP methyl ester carboxylesterase
MSLPGKFLNVGGTRVFYHRSGTRRGRSSPVVLCHGFLVSHFGWRHILPGLAAEHDVIALDWPGFGESDRPRPAEYRYDAVAFMETLLGLLDGLGIERASLVGHSMGGAVAMYTAARRPERVDRLVVIDPLCYPFRVPLDGRIVLLPFIGEKIFKLAYTRSMVRRYFRNEVYRDASQVSEEWIDYVWERLNRPQGFDAAHAALRFVSNPDPIVKSVRAVRAPTMIVWGEDDKLFPSSWAKRLQTDIAGSQTAIIPVCGHAPPEERPKETLEIIGPFLAARDIESRATA